MNETILIKGLRTRDKVIFDYIFNYYYSGICAFAMGYIGNREAVEDLVQDFFVHLWINGPQIIITTSLKSYLFTSIKNRCLDANKHQKVKQKYRSYFLSSEKKDDNHTELMIAESELRMVIQNCMEKLTPRCRQVFEMSRVRGMSNQDISGELGMSKRTVELQISKALRILRTELADYLPISIFLWLIG